MDPSEDTPADKRLERTLNDCWDLGDEEDRETIKGFARDWAAHIDTLDHEQLRRVHQGGHVIKLVPPGRLPDSAHVQIHVYRTGHAYGMWKIQCSPDGDRVEINRWLPYEYLPDGYFSAGSLHKSWSCAIEDWRSDPVGVLEEVRLGKRVAREAAPLLPLPDHLSPDAQV